MLVRNVLTPKRIKFAQLVAAGFSLSDAYRKAFKTARMNEKSIHKEASTLMKNESVKAKVNSLINEADQKVVTHRIATVEEVLETLTDCMFNGQPVDGARIRAAELLGKHFGVFTERLTLGTEERSSKDS